MKLKYFMALLLCYQFCPSLEKENKTEPAFLYAKNYNNPSLNIRDGEALLQEGDLVVRLGQDPSSIIIKNFNRQDKSYSHAGLVLFENGLPFIFHIVNGEENPEGTLRKDSLSRFCNPKRNTSFGIYRYNLASAEIKKLKALIYDWKQKKVQFDSTFNMASNDKMYCSEMISKALAKATLNRIITGSTQLTKAEANSFSVYSKLPFSYTSELRIVAIDNLYIHPFCRRIKKFQLSYLE